MPDDHWSSRGDDRERASTSFCRRQSRIIDSRGTLTSKGPYEHCNCDTNLLEPIHNGVCRIATECSPSTFLWEVSYILLLTLVFILTIIIITDSQNTKIYLSSIDMILTSCF